MNPQEQADADAEPGRFRLEVVVVPRAGLLDPQGQAIQQALAALGYDCVESARHGKAIFLDVQAPSAEAARAQARAMCRKLLANPVTEDFEIRMRGEAPGRNDSGQTLSSANGAGGEARRTPARMPGAEHETRTGGKAPAERSPDDDDRPEDREGP